MPILAWHIPLIAPIFLKRSVVFPILLFSSVSLHCSFKKAFLFLLAIPWNCAFSWVYLSLSPLPVALFFPRLFVKPPQTITLPSCISFSLGWFWSVPGLGRSPGVGNGNPLLSSCLENSMDKESCGLQSMGSQSIWHNWTTKHRAEHLYSGKSTNPTLDMSRRCLFLIIFPQPSAPPPLPGSLPKYQIHPHFG